MTRRFVSPLAAFALAAALLACPPVGAHNPDPLEAAPRAPAVASPVESLTGEVKELIVEDRVVGVTVRYRSLALADGTHLKLDGAAVDRLAHGSRVEVTGRRNGATLFISAARELARSMNKAAKAGDIVRAEGELRMYHVDYFDPGKSTFGFEVKAADDEAIQLKLAVRPEALQRGMRVEVRGVALPDGAIEPETIAITALPDPEPVAKVQQKATKTDNLLVILMRFTDSPAQPFTQAQVQAVVAGGPGSGSVAEYFKEASYGQQLLNATVTPWLSTGSSTPANCNWSSMGTLGRNAATAAGYNLANYQKVAYVFPRVSSCGWLGLGYVGTSGVWVNGVNTTLVYGHELGHNFGLLHAGSLDCGANPIGGSCTASEYGDPFGIMGNSTTMHLNAAQKSVLGWISSTAVKTHTTGSVTYTLNPIETAGGSAYAVKIRAAANRTYWLEYRQPIGFDAGLASYPNNGAQVRVATPFETLCSGCDGYSDDTQFLDMTPATSTFTDGALLAGSSFTDTTYGITFNVLSATASALTLQVVGPGASVTPTTTTIGSSLNPSTVGASVSFTATVTGTSPTGTVNFTANGATISGCGSVALAGSGNVRTAVCATAALVAGSHSIAAAYGGNAGNSPSTSSTLTQTVNAVGSGVNVALASAGATASASSTYSSSFPASAVINNERAGTNWGDGTGGWKDGTPDAWPDWLQINFNGSKTIDRVVVYSPQDNFTNPIEPSSTTTFSLYGVRDFSVQGWNGSAWVVLATVAGNTLVKRTVTFSAYTTDRIRIVITSGLASHARVTEVEAWTSGSLTTTSTILTSSANPANFGTSITFTASTTGSAPTGTVSFSANGSAIAGCGAVTLLGTGNVRTATCATAALAAGSHGIVATYSGNGSNSPSTSATLTQTINAIASLNVALASAGAAASASSTNNTGNPANSAINNERAGANWGEGTGGWKDGTPDAWPDWLQVNFNGSKTIDRVVVYSPQDNYTNPIEPTNTMTFSLYGLRDFTVQGWNGSSWITLGTVTGNNLVKRTVTFGAYATDRIRINVTSALNSYSRIVEVEAWTAGSPLLMEANEGMPGKEVRFARETAMHR